MRSGPSDDSSRPGHEGRASSRGACLIVALLLAALSDHLPAGAETGHRSSYYKDGEIHVKANRGEDAVGHVLDNCTRIKHTNACREDSV